MKYEKELESVLQDSMARWDIPGLGVGIVVGGEIAYAKGFGIQSLETRAPVTPDTVFCVQSVSKCFVATAVMQLVEAGKLELDAPLVQSLPYFQLEDEGCPEGTSASRHSREITIQQVLSHTSGIPDLDDREYVDLVTHPEQDDGAAERFVRSLRDRQLIASPGERFSYSNIGYNVLGDLLAKVTGGTFESVMRERILLPAGMPDSTYTPADIPAVRLAWPHLRSPEMKVNPVYPYHRADAPASFLHTTVRDLCRWAILCLQHGSPPGPALLSSAGYERMWTAVADRGNPRPGIFEDMGLGWMLGHFNGVRTVCHGGAGFGGTAFLLLLPDDNRAAVVLSNEESNAHYLIVRAIADALTGQKPQPASVSWMVPISRALAEGGIEAAYARYDAIKTGQDEYYFGEYELPNLALQLFTAGKIDLAIEVLGLNAHVYPAFSESYLQQAKYFLWKGEQLHARESLEKALAIDPANAAAARLMGKISDEGIPG